MKRIVGSTLLALLLLTASASAAPTYHVIEKISVPGEGGWDYLTVDPAAHRLYLSRSSRVLVLDLDSKKLVGEIPDTAGVHGIALAPEFGKGYTSNGKANTVTVFDLKTLKVLDQIPVGKDPNGIIYDPALKRILTMNGDSHDCTAIDAATGKVAGSLDLAGQPESSAPDGRGHVFVDLEDKSEVVEFDARALKILGHWGLSPGDSPAGLAIDPKNRHLFIGCHNEKMVMFDTKSHKVVGTVPIGKRVDFNGWDPDLGLAFSSNGDGTLTVATAKPFTVLQTVETQVGARTLTLDPTTHRIYLCSATIAKMPTPEERKQGMRPQYAPDSFVVIVVGK